MNKKKLIKSDFSNSTGSVTPALLVIIGSLVVVIYGMLLMLSLQLEYSHRQLSSENALNIAEAGINYYKWHLAHDPDDFTDGTGEDGPYEHTFTDSQGGELGVYSLEITPPSEGSTIITIKSTGWTNQYPSIKRTITAQYGIPSISKYSFLQNASSWYGEGTTVNGQIHSNNGVRMDGVNTSIVSSAKDTYMCGSETGCHPPQEMPGVWGAGPNFDLWEFPLPVVDFDSISFDFANMMDEAAANGLYLDDSNQDGYHIVFTSNGSFNLYRVDDTSYIHGYSVPGQGLGVEGQGGCRRLHQIITSETLLATYQVDETPIVFAEDNLWVEGELDGRITIVAAAFPITSSNVDIWIPNNITYTNYDGSNILGLISQNNIFLAKNLPQQFNLDALLIAKDGKIIRHGYFNWCGGSEGAVKQKLTLNGSVISYFKSYWNFGSEPLSGFIEREINYDNNALLNPPPYFPTSGDYEFISWKEE